MTAATTRTAGQWRRVPERMCVVCRARRPKAGLVRVRRTAEGQVVVDRTGKGPGRGAYVCRARACWIAKGFSARLGSALGAPLADADRIRLAAEAGTLNNDGATDGG